MPLLWFTDVSLVITYKHKCLVRGLLDRQEPWINWMLSQYNGSCYPHSLLFCEHTFYLWRVRKFQIMQMISIFVLSSYFFKWRDWGEKRNRLQTFQLLLWPDHCSLALQMAIPGQWCFLPFHSYSWHTNPWTGSDDTNSPVSPHTRQSWASKALPHEQSGKKVIIIQMQALKQKK